MSKTFTQSNANAFAFPFKRSGELLPNQIVAYDATCGAFTNTNLDKVLCSRPGGDCRPDIIFTFNDTGTGTQTTFAIPFVIGGLDNALIFVDGQLQAFTQYTFARFEQHTDLNFWQAPVANAKIEVLYFDLQEPHQVLNFIGIGNGTTTSQTLPFAVTNRSSLLAFVNGEKTDDFQLHFQSTPRNITTLIFDDVLFTTDNYRIFSLVGFSPLDFVTNSFLSDGTQTTFTLPRVVSTNVQLFVTVNGLKLPITDYSVSPLPNGQTRLTLNSAVPTNAVVDVLGLFGLFTCGGASNVTVDGQNLGNGFNIFNTAIDDGNGNFTLTFKTLVAGTNVNITESGDTVVISATGGSGSAQRFTDLQDVPPNYANATGKFVRVNANEDGLEFVDSSATVTWDGILDKPTTLNDFGITDAVPEIVSKTNGSALPLRVGQAVWVTANGEVMPTTNNSDSVSKFYGLVHQNPIAPGAAGLIQIDGVVENTEVTWKDVTTPSEPLHQGTKYYLTVAGTISHIPPGAGWSRQVGVAASSTRLKLDPQNSIRL